MPSTDPHEWFLPAASTGFAPAYTSGNEVTALVDGQSYLRNLCSTLETIDASGYVHIAAWRLTPHVKLLGDLPNSPSITEAVRRCAVAGAKVRALIWYIPGSIGGFGAGHGSENLEMAMLLEAAGAEVALDDRLPGGSFASHHQKFVVLGDGASHLAFVGGIDIAPDRWDRPAHDDPAGRQRELFDGWHDVQARVEGPAVAQLWESFAQRWNDPRKPNAAPFTPGNRPVRPIAPTMRPSPPEAGSCHVQVLRTYPCRSRDPGSGDWASAFPFAPAGDRTYETALVQAIGKAEHFVYVEDQYLWSCAVVDALAAAARRGVSIILLLTRNYDVPGLEPYHNFLRQRCIDKLRGEAGEAARPVFVFHLRQQDANGGEDIYVHSKTIIIDDRYAVIGSANVNRRSMRTDSEIGIAVVDASTRAEPIGGRRVPVCAFARDYRIRLWREHLGPSTAVDDPLTNDGAPRGWPSREGERVHHACFHVVPEPRHCRPAFVPFVLLNPETPCP
jgi:phosphatidylserine/phosphatidylglycerophosphate/cardiolipin synthase-like enzyme